jgi:hypothetical protein
LPGMIRPALLISVLVALVFSGEPSPPPPGERFVVEGDHVVIKPYPIEERFLNPSSKADEDAFAARVAESLEAYKGMGGYGNTYFENEKQSYPNAFIDFANGQRDKALKFLQGDDTDGWNAQTLMVDWFPCFTIRSQTRKYFFFGGYLDPLYRAKMYESARIWTEKDPLRRPHPAYVPPGEREKKGMAKDGGWTPLYFNSWVDVRATDNLRAMREGAVFLMAEETGNVELAKVYKERIRAYATACYNTGMGEWDSANYLAHTIVGYLQTYDFAKDPEVKALAKGVLDYLSTVAAVAYFKGGVAAPNARDYNNIGPKAGFAGETWLWFGDCDAPESGKPYRDFIHLATSAYRPPPAVLAVARKEFARPVEILEAKPTYEGWFKKPGGEDTVEYPATLYVGNTYQLGTLPFLHRGDVNGFRLGMEEKARGLATVIAFSGVKGDKGHGTATNGKDQVAHYRNTMLWMNREPKADLHLAVPKSADLRQERGWTFVHGERTWLALKPINATGGTVDEVAVKSALGEKDGKSRFPLDTVLTWNGDGSGPCGLFLEVGEEATHGAFDAFVAGVLAKSQVDSAGLASARRVVATGSHGERVAITLTEQGKPQIERGGKPYDWSGHQALYATGSEGVSPVTLGWKQGVLEVKAGGKVFIGRLQDGQYTWENR